MKNNYLIKHCCSKPKLRNTRPVMSIVRLRINGSNLILYVGKDPNFELVCELYINNSSADIRTQPWYSEISDYLPEQHGKRYLNYCYQSFKANELSNAFETMGKVLGKLIEYSYNKNEKH